MKNIASLFINSLITIILSVSLIMCFSTAFNINASLFLLTFCAIMFTAVVSLITYYVDSQKKFFGTIAVIQAVYIAVFLLNYNILITQLNYAANRVLGIYSKYMSVPSSIDITVIGEVSEKADDATVFFIFILFILCEIFVISLERLKKSVIIYIISLLLLVPCFVMVNTLPSLIPLILSVSILFSIFITRFSRKYNQKTGSILLIATSIILVVTLSILCTIFPLQGYERYEWQDTLLSKFNEILSFNSSNSQISSKVTNLKANIQDSQNLSNLGEFRLDRNPVLSVMNNENKTVYLKKIAYADYENNQWKILTTDEAKQFPSNFNAFDITMSTDTNLGQLRINALYREDIIYTTYYSKRSEYGAVADICIENIDNEKEYIIEYYNDYFSRLVKNQSEKLKEYEEFVYDVYTKLPKETKDSLLKIAEENGLSGLSKNEIPQAVKKFIIGRGEYSFVPDSLPEGGDFAPWFIENNAKGYCIHYATSAATLLRALGIPARYVTGYFVPTLQNQFVDVTNCNSHAWVEYYDENKGWIMLDTTPPVYLENGNGDISGTTNTTNNSNSYTQTETEEMSTLEQPTTDANSNLSGTSDLSNKHINQLNIPSILWAILIIALIIAAILLRAEKIRKKRQKLFEANDNRDKIIHIYRYILSINRITETAISEEIQDLVNEAKYSTHKMPDKSVKIIKCCAENERKELYKTAKGIKKLYYKYIKVF